MTSTEVIRLRSIGAEQPIKVLLRFTCQVKPNSRSELSEVLDCTFMQRFSRSSSSFEHPCFQRSNTGTIEEAAQGAVDGGE